MGTVLAGRYELLQRIGRGGTAAVYRANDKRLSRSVAVKIIHDTLSDDPDYMRRFDREARAAASLSHPNIVTVLDRGREYDRSYIIMEYVKGQSLRQIIATRAPLAPNEALAVIDQIAQALAAAHEAGLIHRDIKPENILITPQGMIKVTDFGLAKATAEQTTTASQGVVMGTMSYLAPENTRGNATAASDIYSTGIVLYEMLTGKKPHVGEDISQVIYKHLHEDVPPPSAALTGAARRAIPNYLDALVAGMTAREGAERIPNGRVLEQHVTQVRWALSQGIDDDKALAHTVGPGRIDRPVRTLPLPETAGLVVPVFATEHTPVAAPAAIARAAPPPRQERTPVHQPLPEETPRSSRAPLQPAAGRSAPVPTGATNRAGLVVSRDPLYVRRQRGLIALIILIVLGLCGGGAAYWWFSTGRWTTTPILAGLSESEARAQAADSGFILEAAPEYSETVPAGVIISTDPAAGDRVLKSGTITIVVSLGLERYPMPEVAGLTQAAAETALTSSHLTLGEVTEEWDDEAAPGIVLYASQETGASLPPDTPVDLVVSAGPEPITIEDHTGAVATAATSELEALGFVVETEEVNSATVEKGRVVSQSPDEGTGEAGDVITLTVSLGAKMVEVPSIGGMNQRQAVATLEESGFVVEIKNILNRGNGFGVIAGTEPNAGEMAPEGSTVVLSVF